MPANVALLIRDAVVVDGTGSPGAAGSVLIRDGLIEGVFRPGEELPGSIPTIEAGGKSLCPGFIDLHNHSDVSMLVEPWMDCYLRQGVTTMVVGNCGWSAWPRVGAASLAEISGVAPGDLDMRWSSFADYVDAVERAAPSVNIAVLAGHGTIREQVMGWERRAPTGGELREMQALVSEAMEAGAVGMSSGLIYAPGMYADTDEVAAVAEAVEPFGGIYASHIRGESEQVFAATAEAIEIGRRAGVGTHVSHLKVCNRPMWGRAEALLGLIDDARAAGADVSADQYPYTAWETTLDSFLPPWAPLTELGAILASDRERLRHSVLEGEEGWESSVDGVGWDRIQIVGHARAELTGRTIAEVAEVEGADAFDTCCRLLLDDPSTSIIGHAMHEDDVRTIMARPEVMVGSDGTSTSPQGPLGRFVVHPRYYGTFPRVLGRYVREGVLAFEVAVAKMTSLPADRFRLGGRGRIEPGAVADVVLVDRDRIEDRATYERPHAFANGIDLVIVGGVVSWDGRANRRRSGHVVRLGA